MTHKVEVKNVSDGLQGVRSVGGPVYIRPGQSRTVEFTDGEFERMKRLTEGDRPLLEIGGGSKKKSSTRTASSDTTPAGGEGGEGGGNTPTAPYAKHKGGSSYSVWSADGETELVTGLKKDEADTFNSLDDDSKAAFIESRNAG